MDRNGENNFMDMDNFSKEEIAEKEAQNRPEQNKSDGNTGTKAFWGGLAVGLITAAFLVCIIYLGIRVQHGLDQIKENGKQNTSDLQISADASGAVNADTVQKMQAIEEIIKYYYYKDEDIDAGKMADGIYKGMVESLGDPYSEYFTQEELNSLMQQTQGIYYGIGAGVNIDTDTQLTKIVTVYAGTPAQEAGLRENDLIYEVDGVSTFGLSSSDVVAKIKGEEGTWVQLTIIREGETDYLHIDVQRRKVNVPTVDSRMLEDRIAYIQIAEFDDITVSQFESALSEARANGMKGLVLDLRSNPGGSLDAVVDIAGMMLPKGIIVYTEDKYGSRTDYNCEGDKQLEVPMTVLVNGNSASASEILAGAIKDYGIGTLVGTTTFGKGIVQSVLPMTDGSAVKVTISSYYTPSGKNIHGTGIDPDVECEFDGEAYYGSLDRPDNQLEKAVEVLKGLMK